MESIGPELVDPFEPALDLAEPGALEAVVALAAVAALGHHTDTQHQPQVLGHRRAAYRQWPREVRHPALTRGQALEELTAHGMHDDPEDIVDDRCARARHRVRLGEENLTCQHGQSRGRDRGLAATERKGKARPVRAVLVTGTSTGIGEACVRRLAGDGWTVYAGVRRAEDGDRLAASDGDIRPTMLDVGDADHINQAVAQIRADVGDHGLAGLVNNAGVGVGGPVEYLGDAEWRWVFDINLFGPVALTRQAMPLLRAAGGRIVHIGSVGGRIASPGLAPYSASKHAMEALAEAQRQELRRAGASIRVSIVEPGEVQTAIWDKGDVAVEQLERALRGESRERYGWLVDQSRGFIDEGRQKGVPADRVAKAVEHALTARRPKARYLVGPDAKLLGHVVSRAPDRLRDAMVRMAARRWEARGRKLTPDSSATADRGDSTRSSA
jgi:NAD(P)-dependent dehydrogenase (short-subunit alcohol dehydrogenase family)